MAADPYEALGWPAFSHVLWYVATCSPTGARDIASCCRVCTAWRSAIEASQEPWHALCLARWPRCAGRIADGWFWHELEDIRWGFPSPSALAPPPPPPTRGLGAQRRDWRRLFVDGAACDAWAESREVEGPWALAVLFHTVTGGFYLKAEDEQLLRARHSEAGAVFHGHVRADPFLIGILLPGGTAKPGYSVGTRRVPVEMARGIFISEDNGYEHVCVDQRKAGLAKVAWRLSLVKPCDHQSSAELKEIRELFSAESQCYWKTRFESPFYSHLEKWEECLSGPL
eukprot:m51a1_g14098 hypothetical protein (284) ;mRNA; f:87713-88564